MDNTRKLTISVGASRHSTSWQGMTLYWHELVDKLRIPQRTTETFAVYRSLPAGRKAELKDVGGFVGGRLRGVRRKAGAVEGRDIITLDLDAIPAGMTRDVLASVRGLGCASAVYSTRSHAGDAPRLRVLVPTDRELTPDEYEPCARRLASYIGLAYHDPTTFEAVRLMYWPSCSADSEYIFECTDAPFVSADGLLATFADWHDTTQWPIVPGEDKTMQKKLLKARQADPLAKEGTVGDFCRAYTITAAMDKFLPGTYAETEVEGRYTYTHGSTAGGAVLYDDDKFLYSHHSTDPCSMQLVNAFDMVRLHLYGDQDDTMKPGTPVSKSPSYLAMTALALKDDAVTAVRNERRGDIIRHAFGDPVEPVSEEWMNLLELDGNGQIRKTIGNVRTILRCDPNLAGKLAWDEFASCEMALGSLPWRPEEAERKWEDRDTAGVAEYLETVYGITGTERIESAMCLTAYENRINRVRDFLLGLTWDGIPRLDTLFVDYLGTDDNAYTRAVARKSLCAAVSRAIDDGTKYDYMPIIVGEQGIGKSTLLRTLGLEWFSDSLVSFEGKDAAEMIQGTWINEIGELTALTRQESNAVKQFLSKTDDIYRAAYGRRTQRYPRRCVFFGTSNNAEFLKDSTGNRRFWPIDCGAKGTARKNVWKDLPGEVGQIWAEAVACWRLGEPLYLPAEVEAIAKAKQEEHRMTSGKEGIIEEFLEGLVPDGWESMSLDQRRTHISLKTPGTHKRTKVCAAEIYVECFGGDIRYMRRTDVMEISDIMRRLPGWEEKNTIRFGAGYGRQRGFERVYLVSKVRF